MAESLERLRETGRVGYLSEVGPDELQAFYVWANQFVLARSTLYTPTAEDLWKGTGWIKTRYIQEAEKLVNADHVLENFEEKDLENFLKVFSSESVSGKSRYEKHKLVYAACILASTGIVEVVPGE